MGFPNDPLDPANNPVDRVRLTVGDIDPGDVEMSEELYIYFLDSNSDNEAQAALQALRALVAKYAKSMSEVVGDVEVELKQRYEGYSDLLDKLLKDPAYGLLGVITPYAGGLSFSEKRDDALDTDLRGTPFSVGSVRKRTSVGYDAPFYKAINVSLDPLNEGS